MSQGLHTVDAIQAWLIDKLSEILNLPPETFNPGERFSRYGLKSAAATALIAELATAIGRPLSPTEVWDYPTINELSRHLGGDAKPAPKPAPAQDRAPSRAEDEPLAVIGMACRFPGGSETPERYWDTLVNGIDTITTVPSERWSLDEYYDEDISVPGKMSTRWGGFIENVFEFDPGFFGISPRESVQMDPQQRLMMELSWEALEDAGLQIQKLKGTNTGVFFGAIWNDYSSILSHSGTEYITQHSATGTHYSIVANRVSYTFGFQGPSMAIDTACSSSLVAVHLACNSLRFSESDLTLAGGVNLVIAPDSTVAMSKFGAMSPDGRSKAFDARANGYVRGEGGGVVVLKRLSKALADGDDIYCAVVAGAVNNDGFSNGLTAPNPQAQEAVLQDAYRLAGVDPRQVDYIECHGTGTILGDPIEAKALGSVLGAGRDPAKPLIIGSVKTNLGHLEAAAGIAGMVKVILSMQHKMIPPSLHFQRPNPHIPFSAMNMRVQSRLGPWPENGHVALAGVSGFGFGGTNCHLVLQEVAVPRVWMMPLSASSHQELTRLCRKVRNTLLTETYPLDRLAYTASTRTYHDRVRMGLVFQDRDNLVRLLDTAVEGGEDTALHQGEVPLKPHKICFVCSGQGSQWVGMARSLMRTEPVFRAKLEQCDQALGYLTDWSLLQILCTDSQAMRLKEIDVIQPTIFAIQVALAAQWARWGIKPDVVIGHSMGEVAAAHIAGILSLMDAARVIVHRSQLMKTVSGNGKMAVVGLPKDDILDALEEAGLSERAGLGATNGPGTSVISGDPEAVEQMVADLDAKGVFARLIKVDVASHSQQMEPLCPLLYENLQGLQPLHSPLPLISTVQAEQLEGHEFGPSYWVHNLRRPVLFYESIEIATDMGADVFLEMSPHPILASAVEESCKELGKPCLSLGSMNRDEDGRISMLNTLADLYAAGFPVEWERLHPRNMKALEDIAYFDQSIEPTPEEAANLFVVSGHTPNALRDYAKSMLDYLRHRPEISLKDICYTLGVRRNHHMYRAAHAGVNRGELIERLESFVLRGNQEQLTTGRKSPGSLAKIVFVFSGEGVARAGIGASLFHNEPLFRSIIEECETLWLQHSDHSLRKVILEPEAEAEPYVIQATLFAVQLALARLWRSWGIHPIAVTGLGQGEVAAACVAGVLSYADGIRIVYQRSRWVRANASNGRLILLETGFEDIGPILEKFKGVCQVRSRGLKSTSIMVRAEILDEVERELATTEIPYRVLPAPFYFVGSPTEQARAFMRRNLRGITYQPADTPIYSTLSGKRTDSWDYNAAYWGASFEKPALFEQVLRLLAEAKHEIFLEIGSEPAWADSISYLFTERGLEAAILPTVCKGQSERITMLESLGKLYTLGHPVNWKLIYAHGGRKVALPPVAWQRQTYRLRPKQKPQHLQRTEADGAAAHPLLGREIPTALPMTLYQSRIRHDSLPEAMMVDGLGPQPIPNVAMLELLLYAARTVLKSENAALANIRSHLPLLVHDAKYKTIQSIFEPVVDGHQVKIHGKGDEEKTWTLHLEGRIHPAEKAASKDPSELERLFFQGTRADESQLPPEGHPLAEAFNGCQYTADAVVARISLTEEQSQAADYSSPPLLTLCAEYLVRTFAPPLDEENPTFNSIGDLSFYRIEGRDFWIHITFQPNATQEIHADVCIYDHTGAPVTIARDVIYKALDSETKRRAQKDLISEWCYVVDWQPRSRRPIRTPGMHAGSRWLVFDDGTDLVDQICNELRHRDIQYTRVGDGVEYLREKDGVIRMNPMNAEEYRRLLEEEDPTNILFLWSRGGHQPLDGCTILLRLVKTLVGQHYDVDQEPRLWLFTKGATSIDVDTQDSINQTVFLGMGKVIAQEHPAFWGGLIDMPEIPREDEVVLALDEIHYSTDEHHVAIRDSQRFVSRLTKLKKIPEQPPRFHRDGLYLITGGFGDLGLSLAEWLAEQGAGHLLLLGRRGMPDRAHDRVKEIEAGGATVTGVAVDVADHQALNSALESLIHGPHPLRGVFHCAGVTADGAITSLDDGKFAQVFAPKVNGSWNLHLLTKDLDLDYFVLYSSITAVLGNRGQANYAAANSYLDALATYRNSLGLPGISIGWGPWRDLGMFTQIKGRGKNNLERRGLRAHTEDHGLLALEKLIRNYHGAVAFVNVDWENFPELETFQFYSDLARDYRSSEKNRKMGVRVDLRERLKTTRTANKVDIVKEEIAAAVAQVLELPEGDIPDPRKGFFDMGIDSLMAIELKDKLEETLNGKRLPQTFVFDYPTIDALSTYIAHTVLSIPVDKPTPIAPPEPEPRRQAPPESVEDRVMNLSDEELEASIENKISQWEDADF